MLKPLLQWCTALWYRLIGGRLCFMLDPLFYKPIDLNFRQVIAASPMWSTFGLAEHLLTVLGVCVHPSITRGRFELDPFITRDHVITGYAFMCISAGMPFYARRAGYKILTREHLVSNGTLPEGWIFVSEMDRLWFIDLAEERNMQRSLRLSLYFTACKENAITERLADCSADDTECSICLGNDPAYEWKKIPACGHKFHRMCIAKIKQTTCPLCRAAF
jgi:hypothetical protein